uniref:unspecific monooxygenase n=1 Tax=Plutella xylostella TaxID=51655 RepID=A0A0A7DH14_PLUXY|nr:P450 CYP6 family protein 6 [Plutella xylostella]
MLSPSFCCFIIILLLIYYWFERKSNYWKRRHVKYLTPIPFVGNYSAYIFQKKTIGETVRNICQKMPEEPLIGAFYGTEPVLIVQDPEYIKLVTTTDFYYFNGREVSDHIHKEILTRNLFFTYGDNWNLFRKNLAPFFSLGNMKNMFPLIKEHSKSLDQLLESETRTGDLLDARHLMMRYTLDCICSCSLGMDPKALSSTDSDHPFIKVGHMIFLNTISRGIQTVFRAIWPSIFYALGFKIFPLHITNFFMAIVSKQIHEREGKQSQRHDLIDFVAALKKENYITGESIKKYKSSTNNEKIHMKVDDEIIVPQLISIFAAGFETSATTMTMVLFELAKHPDIQQRVLNEVDKYNNDNNGNIDFDCTKDLPYLDQCIQETLRLYPVLLAVTREVFEGYTFPNGVRVDRGLRVHIPVFHIHRNPKYFKDPDVFDPDRFSPEKKQMILPFTYMPFGKGPRFCIGSKFARMQMMAGLVAIFKKYRIELPGGVSGLVEFEPRSMSTQTKTGVHLKLISRHNKME